MHLHLSQLETAHSVDRTRCGCEGDGPSNRPSVLWARLGRPEAGRVGHHNLGRVPERVCHIVPAVPSEFNGLADYARLLRLGLPSHGSVGTVSSKLENRVRSGGMR